MAARHLLVAGEKASLCTVAARFGLPIITRVTRIESENVTYLLEGRSRSGGSVSQMVVRRYRPGYHSREAIAVELELQQAARHAGISEVPAVRETGDGEYLVEEDGHCYAAFDHLGGEEPPPEALVVHARAIGRLAARLAQVGSTLGARARARFAWDETALGRWGELSSPGPATRRAVVEITEALRQARGEVPMALRHADLRAANLRVADGALIGVLDFDDCGRTFAGFDIAASVSFLEEDRALVAEFAHLWREGYEEVSVLAPCEWALVPHLVMLRRLLLDAWLASHPQAEVPGVERGAFAAGTERIAAWYVEGALGLEGA